MFNTGATVVLLGWVQKCGSHRYPGLAGWLAGCTSFPNMPVLPHEYVCPRRLSRWVLTHSFSANDFCQIYISLGNCFLRRSPCCHVFIGICVVFSFVRHLESVKSVMYVCNRNNTHTIALLLGCCHTSVCFLFLFFFSSSKSPE